MLKAPRTYIACQSRRIASSRHPQGWKAFCSAGPLQHRALDNAEHESASAWRIGCWNQHRVGSYAQRNCPWVPKLRTWGASAAEVGGVLAALPIEHDTSEVRSWVSSCDVAAVQEVDDELRRALAETPSGRIVESYRHVDGRGVDVDCTVGIFVQSGIEVVRSKHAELRIELPRGRGHAVRDHVVALLRKQHASQQAEWLVISSVHLHPPNSVEEVGGIGSYLSYLEPLQHAVQELHDAAPKPPACALVGDFNVSPEDFRRMTGVSPFWASFAPITPADGATAHGSNPCAEGDYGLFRGVDGRPTLPGEWRCQAIGDPAFGRFELYCDRVVAAAKARVAFRRAAADLERVSTNLGHVLDAFRSRVSLAERPPPPSEPPLAASSASVPHQRPPPPPPPPRPAPEQALRTHLHDLGTLRDGLNVLASQDSGASWHLRKGLFTSDHRPLTFELIPQAESDPTLKVEAPMSILG